MHAVPCLLEGSKLGVKQLDGNRAFRLQIASSPNSTSSSGTQSTLECESIPEEDPCAGAVFTHRRSC
jgi:hypothetical protein